MILDTSALLAILLDERERAEFVARIEADPRRMVSAASALEAAMVLEGRKGDEAGGDLDVFLRTASVEIVPFDHDQLAIARSAFRRFGKGRHAAGLNFGDCIAYALSRWTGEPLLYKGTDFSSTDVTRAEPMR
jgi:ribonuclease VapC